jgi:hypothetical protein
MLLDLMVQGGQFQDEESTFLMESEMPLPDETELFGHEMIRLWIKSWHVGVEGVRN